MLRDASPCPGRNKDGGQCKATVTLADGYCFAHSPANGAGRQAARVKGGHGKAAAARAEKLVPSTLRPVLDTLLAALPKIEDGTLDPRQASAMASVAGAITRVYQSGTLEERLQALEAAQQEGQRA